MQILLLTSLLFVPSSTFSLLPCALKITAKVALGAVGGLEDRRVQKEKEDKKKNKRQSQRRERAGISPPLSST